MEEIETLQSIFSEELLVTDRDDGSKLVQYTIMGEAVLSIELNGK